MKQLRRPRQILLNVALGMFLISSVFLTLGDSERDFSIIDSVLINLLLGWFTLITYILGFTNYFRKNSHIRLLTCDIPFVLSSIAMVYFNFTTYQNVEGLDITLMFLYLVPLCGYLPISVFYYAVVIVCINIFQLS